MNKWIKIAFRNIIKNKRRSFVTLMAIAFGFAAINLFSGYTHSVYDGLRASAIRGAGIGHLTIYKEGWNEFGKFDPENYLIDKEQMRKIIDIVEDDDDVILATPQLDISGLVSNGNTSTIFIAQGVVPSDDRTILGTFADFLSIDGEPLNDKNDYGVLIALDLARNLELKPGSGAVVMGATLDGQMNALDMDISGVYDTGVAAINDKFLKIPFKFAQALYDTDKADRIVVLLDHWSSTEPAYDRLLKKLTDAGLNVEMKTWEDLSMFYASVRNMFGMIFLFIFCIVLVIVIMSTVNTMGMAVIERTREIGTLRALGLKRRGVNFLFAIEGAMIGLIGSIAGTVVHLTVWGLITMAAPSYIPPGNSSPVPLVVDLLPVDMAFMAFGMTLLALVAAIFPARRAGKQNVVDALGHV